MKVLQHNNYGLSNMDGKIVSGNTLSSSYTDKIGPLALLYQSGYLTIKSYDEESRLFTLGFPNQEVEQAYFTALIPLNTSARPNFSSVSRTNGKLADKRNQLNPS